jgi:hypothetical protein
MSKRSCLSGQDWSGWHPVRIGDLHTVFRHRYGDGDQYEFPDDDAGRADLHILLDHYSVACPSAIPKVLKMRAPWLTGVERDDLLQEVTRHPRYWSSRALATQLNLTEAQRSSWRPKIRTIAAVDVSDERRKELRKLRNAELQRAKRRARNVKPRDEWLAANSKSREKPWLEFGMGRSAYYKHLKAGSLPDRGQVRQHPGQVRQQSSLRSDDTPVHAGACSTAERAPGGGDVLLGASRT